MDDGLHIKPTAQVVFVRSELDRILGIYGRMVAAGLWRDYAISLGAEEAVFAIHARASERPIYEIIKCPALARRQGMWLIRGSAGQVVKRGARLDQLLRFFDKSKFTVIG